ncbi:hypothetical protein PGSY75_0621700 [Plasmodium gaboni]|uniref:RAP domain-containing protein n=1 Tax=Plasmodium gaboni TaxID=647221 RepID=A0A151LRZ4_9APIC|nr:hypothetical protein PGSY75_0621700 [Plasmodium gaboni]KYO01909.1 hypothetical protein PGSY75_0621700 [Plasmodium gaboni]
MKNYIKHNIINNCCFLNKEIKNVYKRVTYYNLLWGKIFVNKFSSINNSNINHNNSNSNSNNNSNIDDVINKDSYDNNDLYLNKQKEFLSIFDNDESSKQIKEQQSTVKIFNNKDMINSKNELLLNDKTYNNFITQYNDIKLKNKYRDKDKINRFSNNVNLHDEEKSLWEILKEKEDHSKLKKKMKTFHKDMNEKINREYEKIKKDEKYLDSQNDHIDNKYKKGNKKFITNNNNNFQNVSDHTGVYTNKEEPMKNYNNYIKKNKKNNIDLENINEDIDTFLQNDKKYINDIKSYDEIYQEGLSVHNNSKENIKMENIYEDNLNENKNKINKNEYMLNDHKDEIDINNLIQEDLKYQTGSSQINPYGKKMNKLASDILINDLNEPQNNNINNNNKCNVSIDWEKSLFVDERDDISAKVCIDKLSKGQFNDEKKNMISKDLEILHNNNNNNNNDMISSESCVVDIKANDIIKKISGENLSTIIDGNIDNLIIQREIKKEKSVSGIINVLYNNLKNCDIINLSSALVRISKLIDSYQKESIIKNYMFLSIIKKIEENMNLFEISNLVQLFYAFVKIDYYPYFFNDIIFGINNKIDELNTKQICSVFYTLSNIILETNESRSLKLKMIDLIKRNISSFVCLNDIICLLTSLSKLKYKDVYVYYDMSKKIEDNIDNLNMKHISNILWAFSNVNYTSKLVKKVKKIIEKNIHQANYLDIVNIIYSLTKLNEYDEYLYNDVFYNAINIYIHNMTIKNLCIILWSYTYASNIEKHDLYINILTKINENMKHITTKDIVSILTCLSRIKYNYRYKDLFNHLKNKIIKSLYSFTPLQLTNVIYHSSFLDIYDHKFYYLLIQQAYQIRKLLYLENFTLILYALKNISYLNVHNFHVFQLISYILHQIKNKYKLLSGEDCINIMLIIKDLQMYENSGYFSFTNIQKNYINNNDYHSIDQNNANNSMNEQNNKCQEKHNNKINNIINIFDDNVDLEYMHFKNNNETDKEVGEIEEIYLPYINDLLYEQIKIRLNNFWQLNIKDVNNLLIIMKNMHMYDDIIINMIMRQIIPILLKSTSMEFLIFLSNINPNKRLKYIILTHLSRRPKLISVFKKKINSITSRILNNVEENDQPFILNNGQLTYDESNTNTNNHHHNHKDNLVDINKNEKISQVICDNTNIDNYDNEQKKNALCHIGINKKNIKTNVDINSCIALTYACFNIHYEDDNILKLYDIIEHMILEEKKGINSFMLINFIYILTLTNNKLELAKRLSQEYMHFRYETDLDQKHLDTSHQIENNNNINNSANNFISNNVCKTTNPNISFNLLYNDEQDNVSFSYIENGDEESCLILLKLLYVNIILNNYNYLYHILSEISKYSNSSYSHEFLTLSKQVCYHIYNFTDFISKNKEITHLWIKVFDNVYICEDNIYMDLDYERTTVNLINQEENQIVNLQLNNKKICKGIDNNLNIAKFFYYILNFNMEDINNGGVNHLVSKKEKKKVKMFHFDHIITDILNFLNIEYKGSYTHENIYNICCSFPYERHLIDLISYEDVLYPSNKPLLSSELRQKQLALKGWTVHSINFRDVYNSIKDKNIISYIFNICKKIKKNLNTLTSQEKKMEEKDFWENLKYANI